MRPLRALQFVVAALCITAPVCAAEGVEGHYRCGFTDYMWPSALDDSPTATGNGTIEYDSTASGRIQAGTMTEHLADDTRRFGEKTCTFNLVSGESSMNSPDSGTTTFTWQLRPGSDGHCGASIRNAPNLGLTESARDKRTLTTSSQFFIAADGSSRWASSSAAGVSIGTCRKVQ